MSLSSTRHFSLLLYLALLPRLLNPIYGSSLTKTLRANGLMHPFRNMFKILQNYSYANPLNKLTYIILSIERYLAELLNIFLFTAAYFSL